jgi:hypothetical protein
VGRGANYPTDDLQRVHPLEKELIRDSDRKTQEIWPRNERESTEGDGWEGDDGSAVRPGVDYACRIDWGWSCKRLGTCGMGLLYEEESYKILEACFEDRFTIT